MEEKSMGSILRYIWRFPSMGIPENGWFLKVYTVMENPIKMDVLGVAP